MTKLTLSGQTYLYVYDAANRLTQVKNGAGSTIASYTYDGDGLRLTKTVNGVTTTYHYFQGELMYETLSSDPANVIHALYLRSPSGKIQGVKLYNPDSGTYNYYYYHYNAQGDVIAVTDFNGAVYRQYVYDPYGNVISVKDGGPNGGNPVDINNDPGFNNAYTYRGYRYDSEAGLYFLNSRYYAAGIGRFLTKDTFKGIDKNPQSLNRYAYAEGDPVNLTDPSGDVAVAGDGVGEKPYSAWKEATGETYSLTPKNTSITSQSPKKAVGASSSISTANPSINMWDVGALTLASATVLVTAGEFFYLNWHWLLQ